jgi:D-alanyl-D-alanine carboxypeptidase/D-alanyl-D-alanine-endopeptidase (penicillin-binding protein 4)
MALAVEVCLHAQTYPAFEDRLNAVVNRPEYRHSRFGMEFYSLEDRKVLYSRNAQELFVPGSTTKILTVGTALELLGPDFRFHTKVYRTGSVQGNAIEGDLILVASGDPNLSNRIQPDGTMLFENEDHSYDGFAEAKPVRGHPLAVLRELASKIAAKGIRRVNGRVLVDASLFPEGTRELGTGVVISPIVVNDNLVDVTVTPGDRAGDRAVLTVSPRTRYVTVMNDVKTAAVGEKTQLQWKDDSQNPDGTHTVSLSGVIPVGAPSKLRVYKVPVPSRFCEVVFEEVLEDAGIRVLGAVDLLPANRSTFYKPENEVAEHLSPTLREEAKVILKVSQNLHASMLPYIVGAYLQEGSAQPLRDGFRLEAQMMKSADLDLTSAVQNDGAGGSAYFSPDFMLSFLLHLTRQRFFEDFRKSLPVLGKDGTLYNIQINSPAAGHVLAKTGTLSGGNALTDGGGVITGKGLAGFVEAKGGRHIAFAAYINFVPVAMMDESATKMAGDALGEIAAAAYDGFSSGRGDR